MRILESIQIENFKSIRKQTLALGRLNVFIGGNGSGKSNLIQVFHLLREIQAQRLGIYSETRGANRLLHFGRRTSPFMELWLEFREGDLANRYRIRLIPTDESRLIVESESVFFQDYARFKDQGTGYGISSGSKEAAIGNTERIDPPARNMARFVQEDLQTYQVYHFHDTSDSAPVKQRCRIDDNRALRPDAGNLAAFLYYLSLKKPDHFRNIEETIRQIAPFFDRFELKPLLNSPDETQLEWKERGSDDYFGPASLSDGTLRFMCLATLLLQPTLPAVVLLDEPELGLHPAAISLLASLLSSASSRAQVIVATQSVTLVNQLEPQDVWTVERQDRASIFKRLIDQNMSGWLDDYALGELWEKNILGARP